MDCLEGMKKIKDQSVDMILCDLPYNTTNAKWDVLIPFDKLWGEYKRIIKENGAIVLTASQPFTSALIMSNREMFRYEIIWDKVNRYTGFLDAKIKPLKRHENICVFYKKQPIYNPQMTEGEPYKAKRSRKKGTPEVYGKFVDTDSENKGTRKPFSILSIKADRKKEMGLHPTQKPIELFEYLIKTYTNENDLILDNCIGSGTTAIACLNTNRKFIGFELEKPYFEIANERINQRISRKG